MSQNKVWIPNGKTKRPGSAWLDPALECRLEKREKELKKLIDVEISNGNPYVLARQRDNEKNNRRKQRIKQEYLRKLKVIKTGTTEDKESRVPRSSWILRWDKNHQRLLWEKFVEYANIGISRYEMTALMSPARFLSFARHCGLCREVKMSKIIRTIRKKAAENYYFKKSPSPREIITKKAAYKGPGAVPPSVIDLLFTKVHRKSHYARKVIDFEGFCEMVERLAIDVFRQSPQLNRAKAIEVIKNMKLILTGTKSKPNKFHDDKQLYTGVWRNGGPQALTVVTLCNMMDRSPANVRGVNIYYSPHKLEPYPIRKLVNSSSRDDQKFRN
ncbi:hypothetical protein AAMO2058_000929000 [Amorphochlora amoebiformis]